MKSDEEFLTGIYRKAEQRRKEEGEGQMPVVPARRKWRNRITVIGMAAACFCFLLAFSVYGKKLTGDMESGQQGIESERDALNPGNPDAGIQTLDLGEVTGNPIDGAEWPAGQQRARIVQMPVTLFGTVLNYTAGTEDTMAVLSLETEEFGELEIYITYKEEFTQGEEVALLLTVEENMYYLTDSGQKYKKGEDGLYYNTFGEVLSENIGEAYYKGIGG